MSLRGTKNHYTNDDCFEKDTYNMVVSYQHPNCDIKLHSHDFWEINMVVSGTGKHHIEKMSFSVTPGDVFVIPINVKHGYTCREKLNVYHILICKDFFQRYSEELKTIPGFNTLFEIEPQLRQSSPNKFFLHLNHTQLQQITAETDKITAAYESLQFMYQNVLTLHLVCDLCLKYHSQINHPVASTDIPGTNLAIIHALEYIQRNLDKKLTVEEIAHASVMSGATFHRHFKQMLGMTPMEYVIKCRVERALRLIEENRFSKAEIALMTGFYDSSHMDKYIKSRRKNSS